MLAGHFGEKFVGAERGTHAHAVGGHCHALTGAADEHAELGVVRLDLFGHSRSEKRIVAGIQTVGTFVLNRVSPLCQRLDEELLEIETAVIGTDDYGLVTCVSLIVPSRAVCSCAIPGRLRVRFQRLDFFLQEPDLPKTEFLFLFPSPRGLCDAPEVAIFLFEFFFKSADFEPPEQRLAEPRHLRNPGFQTKQKNIQNRFISCFTHDSSS